jgi:hypothetical protein
VRGEIITEYKWRNMREDFLDDPEVNWRMILKWIFYKWDWGTCWIDAYDRDRWRTVVNAVMNLRVI